MSHGGTSTWTCKALTAICCCCCCCCRQKSAMSRHVIAASELVSTNRPSAVLLRYINPLRNTGSPSCDVQLQYSSVISIFSVSLKGYTGFVASAFLPPPWRICFRRCLSVCLPVCLLLATLRKNFVTDLHEIFREGWQWANEQLIKFWWVAIRITVWIR